MPEFQTADLGAYPEGESAAREESFYRFLPIFTATGFSGSAGFDLSCHRAASGPRGVHFSASPNQMSKS
jgi:hypothetical protein